MIYSAASHSSCNSNPLLSFFETKHTDSSLLRSSFCLSGQVTSFLLSPNSYELTLDYRRYLCSLTLEMKKEEIIFFLDLVGYLTTWTPNFAFLSLILHEVSKDPLPEPLDLTKFVLTAFSHLQMHFYRPLLWLPLTFTNPLFCLLLENGERATFVFVVNLSRQLM